MNEPDEVTPYTEPPCPPAFSGASQRRPPGFTRRSRSGSWARSSPHGPSGSTSSSVFATALAAVGFFQALLDLTVEESLTKYGFRYVSTQDWGRLRRLFRQMLLLKVVGGVLASLLLVALAPAADMIFDETGVGSALLAGPALLPLVQSAENVGATALLLRSRYDLRGAYQTGSAEAPPHRDRNRRAMRRPRGTCGDGRRPGRRDGRHLLRRALRFRRFPHAPPRPLGEDVPGIRSFVLQSTVATGVISLRTTLRYAVILGVVAGPPQVGLFRIAQTPQTGLAAASSPARRPPHRADARLGGGRHVQSPRRCPEVHDRGRRRDGSPGLLRRHALAH